MSGFWEGERDEGWQKLAARLDEKTRQFWAIDSVSNAIRAALSTEELLRTSLERVVDVTGAAAGAVYLASEGGTWTLAAVSNLPAEIVPRYSTLRANSPLVTRVLESKNPVSLAGQKMSSEPHSSSLDEDGLQPWAAVAMTSLDVSQGILVLFSRGRRKLGQANQEVLRVIGHLVGLSLANTLAHEVALARVDKQLEQRLAEMETVLSSMSDGLLICDGEGTIVRANRSAEIALGQPVEELLGQSVLAPEWNHLAGELEPRQGDTHGPLSGVIMWNEECKDCFLQVRGESDMRIVRVSASTMRSTDGSIGGAVINVRDVTEEQHARQVEGEFLSLLSHELRAPLTVISGYAQMMSRKLSRQGLTEEAAAADLIKAQVARMSGMVGDLVESGRLEEGIGEVSRETTDLEEIVRDTVARISREQRHGNEKHPITVEVEPGLPNVEADPRRLDQVLTNFLSNAIRYSPDGGQIEVTVGRQPSPDRDDAGSENLLVTVSDSGIGIPPEEQAHVFERAFRGKAGQLASAQGLGLGLYICKLIIKGYGGQIGVTNGRDGIGSAFWFTIPAASQEATE